MLNLVKKAHPVKTTARRVFLKSALLASLSGVLAACGAPLVEELTVIDSQTVVEKQTVEVTRVIKETVEKEIVVPGATSTRDEDIVEGEGIIWYVDIEHENAVNDPQRKAGFDRVRAERTMICGMSAGVRAESIHYWEITTELAAEKNVLAICISGNTTDWWEYDFDKFLPLSEILHAGKIPVIAFCGGHQLLAILFGGSCDAIRKFEQGEEDPDPGWATGYFKEVGYLPLEILAEDPIFDGCGMPPEFYESHYWEVKNVPEVFSVLAKTKDVGVQVMKHKDYLLYGTQFHPEVHDLRHPDGSVLLKNFFILAGIRSG